MVRISSHIEQYNFIITLEGDLLAESAPAFQAALYKAMEEYPACVAIDCRNLRYLSTACLNVMLSHQPIMKARRIQFSLRHVNPKLYHVLQLLRLHTHFHIVPEAVTARGNSR